MSQPEEASGSQDFNARHEQQISESLVEDSSKVVSNMSTFSIKSVNDVVDVLVKSYTELPVSEAAVGPEESKALTDARTELTSSLVLYNKVLLPLSNVLVQDLRSTLGYFKDDYESFRVYLSVVIDEVKEAEERALFVHEAYVKLASDLKELAAKADTRLKAAQIGVQTREDDAKSKAHMAKKLTYGAFSLGVGGLGGGAWLALGLLGPGGFLFAPAFAGTAFIGGVLAGTSAASVTGAFSKKYSKESKMLQVVSNQLKAAGEVHEKVFVEAIEQFADCMKDFATFFNNIGNQLAIVNKRLNTLNSRKDRNDTEEMLKCLYRVVKREADNLLKACDRYNDGIVGVKINIGLLERFELHNFWSYIDEWFNNFPSEGPKVESIKKFINKAVPGMQNALRML